MKREYGDYIEDIIDAMTKAENPSIEADFPEDTPRFRKRRQTS